MDKLKIIRKLIFGLPIYWISKIISKDKNLEIIGSSIGKYFADNPKYFFINFYKSNNLNVKLVWITKSKKVVEEIENINLPVVYLYSFKGFFYVLRASKAFISHQLDDISGSLMGGALIVQLWHGIPLKKIGFGGDWNDKGFFGKLKVLIFKLFPYSYYMTCDIVIAPTKNTKEVYLESFSKSFRNNKIQENIILSRQPRTLYFDKNLNFERRFFPEIDYLLSLDSKYDKIISWLPTQRKQLSKTLIDVINDSNLDFNKINNFCKSKNYLFVLKAHFLDFKSLSDISENFDNILVYKYPDPYPLLKYTSILITDYSSVFFDYLFLKRPIIFMCHDLDEYIEKVDFYYDLKSLKLGSIFDKWSDVINNIDLEHSLSNKKCSNKEEFGIIENDNLRREIEKYLSKKG